MWPRLGRGGAVQLLFQSPDGGEFRCGMPRNRACCTTSRFQSPDGGEFRCGDYLQVLDDGEKFVSVP